MLTEEMHCTCLHTYIAFAVIALRRSFFVILMHLWMSASPAGNKPLPCRDMR